MEKVNLTLVDENFIKRREIEKASDLDALYDAFLSGSLLMDLNKHFGCVYQVSKKGVKCHVNPKDRWLETGHSVNTFRTEFLMNEECKWKIVEVVSYPTSDILVEVYDQRNGKVFMSSVFEDLQGANLAFRQSSAIRQIYS